MRNVVRQEAAYKTDVWRLHELVPTDLSYPRCCIGVLSGLQPVLCPRSAVRCPLSAVCCLLSVVCCLFAFLILQSPNVQA